MCPTGPPGTFPQLTAPHRMGMKLKMLGMPGQWHRKQPMQTWNTMAITRDLYSCRWDEVGQTQTGGLKDKDRPGRRWRLDGHQGAGSGGQIAAAGVFSLTEPWRSLHLSPSGRWPTQEWSASPLAEETWGPVEMHRVGALGLLDQEH